MSGNNHRDGLHFLTSKEDSCLLCKNVNEAESALLLAFCYPIILSSKINSSDVDLIACNSFLEAYEEF